MRIGFAEDIHKLVSGRKLILGGVDIPFSLGLLGHSDADVVYHAVAESILGALAKGDLGKHFPDTSDETKDMDSSIIVTKVVEMMNNDGYSVNNIDVSIICEKPKLAPYILSFRENIAKLLKTDISNVSVKACTNEGLDEVGKGNAIIAKSIVLLNKI